MIEMHLIIKNNEKPEETSLGSLTFHKACLVFPYD